MGLFEDIQAKVSADIEARKPKTVQPIGYDGGADEFVRQSNERLNVPSQMGVLEEFGHGVTRGYQQMSAGLGGAIRAIGDVTGIEPISEIGKTTADYWNEKAAQNVSSAPSIENVEGIGDIMRYGARATGEFLPQMAAAVVGGAVGGVPAIAAHTLSQEMGSIYNDQPEGEKNIGRAVAGAVPAAALDVMPTAHLLSRTGILKALQGKAIEQGLKHQDVLKAIVKNAGVQTLEEVPTETLQTAFERFGASKELWSPEAKSEYLNTAASTAMGMAPIGGFGGGVGAVVNNAQVKAQEKSKSGEVQAPATADGEQYDPETGEIIENQVEGGGLKVEGETQPVGTFREAPNEPPITPPPITANPLVEAARAGGTLSRALVENGMGDVAPIADVGAQRVAPELSEALAWAKGKPGMMRVTNESPESYNKRVLDQYTKYKALPASNQQPIKEVVPNAEEASAETGRQETGREGLLEKQGEGGRLKVEGEIGPKYANERMVNPQTGEIKYIKPEDVANHFNAGWRPVGAQQVAPSIEGAANEGKTGKTGTVPAKGEATPQTVSQVQGLDGRESGELPQVRPANVESAGTMDNVGTRTPLPSFNVIGKHPDGKETTYRVQATDANSAMLEADRLNPGFDSHSATEITTKPEGQKSPSTVNRQPLTLKSKVNPEKDDIAQAIAKLGGIDRADAERQWGTSILQSPEWSKKSRWGNPVFRRNNGVTIDKMAEALAGHGYLPTDENGKADVRALEDMLDRYSRGEKVEAATKSSYDAEAEALEKEYLARFEDLTDDDLNEISYWDFAQDEQNIIEEIYDAAPDFEGLTPEEAEARYNEYAESIMEEINELTGKTKIDESPAGETQEGGEGGTGVVEEAAGEETAGGRETAADEIPGHSLGNPPHPPFAKGGDVGALREAPRSAPHFKGAAAYPGSPDKLAINEEVRVTAKEAQEIADYFDKGRLHRLTHRDYFGSGVDHGNPKYGHRFRFQSSPVRGITSFSINGDDLITSVKDEAAQGDGVLYAIRPEDIGGEFVVVRKSDNSVFLYSNSPVDTGKAEVIAHGLALKAKHEALQNKVDRVYELDMEDESDIQQGEAEEETEVGAIREAPEKIPTEPEKTGAQISPVEGEKTETKGKPLPQKDVRKERIKAFKEKYGYVEAGDQEPATSDQEKRKSKFTETRRKHLETKLLEAKDKKEIARLQKALEGLKKETAPAFPEFDNVRENMERKTREKGILTDENYPEYRKLAQAVAAVEGKDSVRPEDAAEAIQYIQANREDWRSGYEGEYLPPDYYARKKMVFDKAGIPLAPMDRVLWSDLSEQQRRNALHSLFPEMDEEGRLALSDHVERRMPYWTDEEAPREVKPKGIKNQDKPLVTGFTTKPTGFPDGTWYVIDPEGEVWRGDKAYGEMPPRFKTAEAAKAKAQKLSAKIEDFGEKIGGARKDTSERGYTKSGKAKEEETAEPWRKKYVAMEKVDGSGWIIGKAGDSFGISARNSQIFATQEEAEAAIPVFAVAEKHFAQRNQDDTYSIYKKTGERKRLKVVNMDFVSREEAMKYMATHAVELLNQKTSFGEEILPAPELAQRKGPERRKGPATPEMFMETFAPRGIEFGNWNNQEERQQVMNHAYDGLLDLAEVLGVPPKALMLNGDLAIAFGARGQGLVGAKAHYELDYGVINLTKMKGAGSLAHEWFHALDHYLGRLDTKAKSEKEQNKRGDMVYPESSPSRNFLSHGESYKSKARPELLAAYKNIIETMYKKAEQYVEDTEKADKFVGTAREELRKQLDGIRNDLARDNTSYSKAKGGYRISDKGLKPASAEQLAEFDRLADILVEGGGLETSFRYNNQEAEKPETKPAGMKRAAFGRLMSGRHSNDTLDAISAIYKAVRNRSGFAKEGHGPLDRLRSYMSLYAARLKMFEDAKSGTEKTKKVPTLFAMEAKKMDQARSGDYWSEPHEMAARAFAAYVEDKVAEAGGQSDFLVYHAHGGILLPMIDGFVARPYPEGKEREAINGAMQKFVDALKTEETEKGIKIFEPGTVYGIIDKGETSYEIQTVSDGEGKPESSVKEEHGDLDRAGRVREQLALFTPAESETPAQEVADEIKSKQPALYAKAEKFATGVMRSAITRIKTAADAAHIALPLADMAQEHMIAIVTDQKGKVLGVVQHTTGALNQSIVHPRDLLGVCHDFPGAAAVWLAHNHPSGDPTSSPEDRMMTERVEKAVAGSGLELKGHIIVGKDGVLLLNEGGWGENVAPAEGERKRSIPTYQRRILEIASDRPRLTSPEMLKEYLKQEKINESGLLFVDGKNRPTTFLPMTEAEMSKLKTGQADTGSSRIMRTFHETNSVSMIAIVDGVDSGRPAVSNIASFGNVLGVKVLDGISLADGESMVRRGVMPAGADVFYSNPMLDPAVIVKELAGLAGNIKAAMPKLVELGRYVKEQGAVKFDEFVQRMKQHLQELWQAFKPYMLNVWTKLQEERGSVSIIVKKDIEGWKEQIQKANNGTIPRTQPLVVGHTPKVLKDLRIKADVVAMTQRILEKVLTGKWGNREPISIEEIERLPQYLHDPVAIYEASGEQNEGALTVITDMKNTTGKPVLVGIWPDQPHGRALVNFVATAYGNEELTTKMKEWEEKGLRLYPKNKPLADMTSRIAMSRSERSAKGSDNIKPQSDENVKFVLREKVPQWDAMDLSHGDVMEYYGLPDDDYGGAGTLTSLSQLKTLGIFDKKNLAITDQTPATYPQFAASKNKQLMGLKASTVEDAFRPIYDNLKNAPPWQVVQSVEDLPKTVLTEAEKRGILRSNLQAVYIGNKVYYVADSFRSVDEAKQIILEEVVVHHGLRGIMDKSAYERNMLQAALWYANKNTTAWKEIGSLYKLDLKSREGCIEAAEEMLGRDAREGKDSTVLSRVIAAVKEFLRKIGLNVNYGEAEIREIIGKARRFVEGREAPAGNMEVRYAAAWHGSPHDFDKFSASAIGTGEGAQAYGHGLYFAGKREVAEYYRDKFNHNIMVMPDGKELKRGDSVAWLYPEAPLSWRTVVQDVLDHGADENALKHRTRQNYEAMRYGATGQRLKKARELMAAWRQLQAAPIQFKKNESAKIYHVELAPKEDEYLLWDKPLSEQSEKVKEAINNLPHYDRSLTGERLYESLASEFRSKGGQEYVSSLMHSLGIRGIKYLDGTSRDKGEGNYNYVIFSDDDVTISAKFALAQNLADYTEHFDGAKTWEGLKRLINPFDWSRLKKSAEEITPTGIQNGAAHFLRNPFFAAEADENKRPFVDTGIEREETKLDHMLKFFGWKGNREETPNVMERLKKTYTQWETSDRTTEWGRIVDRFQKLSVKDRKGVDLLLYRGDVDGKVFPDYESVKGDSRFAGVSEAAFNVYKEVRNHIDTTVADAIEQISRQFMVEAGTPADVIEKHISDYRRELRKHKGWLPRNHGQGDRQVNVYHVINSMKWRQNHYKDKSVYVLPYYPGAELADKIKSSAEFRGLKYWQDSRGRQYVSTDGDPYENIRKELKDLRSKLKVVRLPKKDRDAFAFDIEQKNKEIKALKEKLAGRLKKEEKEKVLADIERKTDEIAKKVAEYKQFSKEEKERIKKEIAEREEILPGMAYRSPKEHLESFRKHYDQFFDRYYRDRLLLIHDLKEQIRQAKEDRESATVIGQLEQELAKLGDGRIKVKVYMRLNETKRRADKHLAEVKADLKKFIPESHIDGERYEVSSKFADQLTEDMYGDMRNDFAMEQAQLHAIEYASKRGDITKKEAAEMRNAILRTTAETLMARGSGAHQIRRANYLIEGYDKENTPQIYHDYMTGAAGMLSKARYAHDQFENFRMAKPEVKPWAYDYIKSNLRNMGYADSVSGNLRAVASFMYLGFKVSSMVINATQPWTLGVAELGRHTKRSAVYAIGKAQKDILSGKRAKKEGDSGLTEEEFRLFNSKIFKLQEMETAVHEMSGTMAGTTGKTSRFFRTLTDKALAPFQEVELLNRKTMILAAYRTFVADGISEANLLYDGRPLPEKAMNEIHMTAMEKALDVNRAVNFEMSRANLPVWVQDHPIMGRLPYALQSFMWNNWNWIYNRLTSGQKEDMKALIRYAAAMAIIGGAAALPGWDELDKLYQKLFGRSPKLDLKEWTGRYAKEYGTVGEMVNGFAWHGLASAGGVNISNAIRLQIPIVSPILSGETLPEAGGGVFTGLVQKGIRAGTAASRGDIYRTAESLAPEFIAGGMRAYRMATEGATTGTGKVLFDEHGKPLKMTPGEAATRMLGFQPSEISERSEITNTAKGLATFWKGERDDLLTKLRLSAPGEERRKAMLEIIRFNTRLRSSQVDGLISPIKTESIKRALTAKPDKKKMGFEQKFLD